MYDLNSSGLTEVKTSKFDTENENICKLSFCQCVLSGLD